LEFYDSFSKKIGVLQNRIKDQDDKKPDKVIRDVLMIDKNQMIVGVKVGLNSFDDLSNLSFVLATV